MLRGLHGRGSLLAVVAALSLAALGGIAAHAYEPVGPEPRFSTVGTDGVAARDAEEPAVAYNSTANQYLVVWQSDEVADDEDEIYGQLVNAAGGEIGGDFRISEADVSATRDARSPQVAYNGADNEYLVVWEADNDPDTDNKFEIYGQLLDAAGGDIGSDFPISSTGLSTDITQGVLSPAVTHNPNDNEYLVVWPAGNVVGSDTIEIHGQRLGPAGAELGADDFQVSDGSSMGPERQALHPSVSYGSGPDEYLVTWDGDGLTSNNDYEVFGQRLSDSGVAQGGDIRLSTTGTEGLTQRAALEPSVAYGSGPNEYLVTWWADALALDDETEIFGQRVSAAGVEQGANDFRISTTLPDNTPTRSARRPTTAYSPAGNEYLVTWAADALATDEKFEIFGQRLSATGGEIGANDFRISNTGADTAVLQDAEDQALAFGTTPNEYLVTWAADPLATDEEFEIFGRRLRIVAPPATTQQPGSTATQKCKKPKKKKKKKRAAPSKKKTKKKGCKKKKKKRK